jgi:hypothetical protein
MAARGSFHETGGLKAARSTPMNQEYQIGRQITYLEAPDIIVMKLFGKVSQQEGSEINRRHLEMGRDADRLFYLIDMSEFEGMDPELRKEAGLTMKTLPLRGIAVYNASLTARVVSKLIVGAMNVFKAGEEKAPFEAFPTEEEARAWIAGRRRQLLAAA